MSNERNAFYVRDLVVIVRSGEPKLLGKRASVLSRIQDGGPHPNNMYWVELEEGQNDMPAVRKVPMQGSSLKHV